MYPLTSFQWIAELFLITPHYASAGRHLTIEKLEAYWRSLILALPAGEVLDGAPFVCYPKIPLCVINHAADINLKEEKCSDLMKTAEEYFHTRGVSHVCFRVTPLTRPRSFSSTLKAAGFKAEDAQSVMVLKDPATKSELTPNLVIKQVATAKDIDVFDRLMFAIFGMPNEWKDSFDEFTRESIQSGWMFYLGYVGETPVGTCALFSSGSVGGIFNVGTLAEYRKQGIGAALTLHALTDSVAAGNLVHTLQAETGGNAERLYEKLGFRADHKIQFFTKEIR